MSYFDIVGGLPPQGDDIAETSPSGRYVRFSERLGSGVSKDVFRAYDTSEGMEVAWNIVKLSGVPKYERNRFLNEVRLMERLQHPNVIGFHGSWVNRERQEVHFITEILSSLSLKSFVAKVKVIRWKVAKRWLKQILEGLQYLHSQRIIHRDLKCDNIFIDGTRGDLRIGGMRLCTALQRDGPARTILGTTEFMAPEMYEETVSYDEKVDIYSFAMCMLEICTNETPYKECKNPGQIYKKVSTGKYPHSLEWIQNPEARDFILFCLGRREPLAKDKYVRPSTAQLLSHPFLNSNVNDQNVVRVYHPTKTPTPIATKFLHPSKATTGMPPTVSSSRNQQQFQGDSTGSMGSVKSSEPCSHELSNQVPHKTSINELYNVPQTSDSDTHHLHPKLQQPSQQQPMLRQQQFLQQQQQLQHQKRQRQQQQQQQQQQQLQQQPVQAQQLQQQQQQQDTQQGERHGQKHHCVIAIEKRETHRQGKQQGEGMIIGAGPKQAETDASSSLLSLFTTLEVKGQTQYVQFDFDLVKDDPISVAREMVSEFGLQQDTLPEISKMIDSFVQGARIEWEAKQLQVQTQSKKEDIERKIEELTSQIREQQQQQQQQLQQQQQQQKQMQIIQQKQQHQKHS